jgi:hypothetical protein
MDSLASPIKTWQPHKRQADFLSLPDSIFEAMYGGAAGGGKSETLLMMPIARQFHLHPRFKGIILRRTYPELEAEIILRAPEFYGPCGATYNDTKKRWTFPSGAVVQFGHCENEKDVKKYDTSQYNYAAFDELTSFTEYQYIYIAFTRVRSSDNRLPAIVRSGTNPGNIGHTWVYNRFIKPCQDGYKIIRRKVFYDDEKGKRVERQVDAIFIPSRATDNIYLMDSDPNYLSRLAALPAGERAAKLEGRWDSFEGQVFDDFSEHTHVVQPFTVPYYWPSVLSIDWGYAAMTCAGLYRINPVPSEVHPAKIYKTKEHTCVKTKVSTWATDIRRMTSDIELTDVVLDPSAWQERGTGLIAQEFAEAFGRPARKANNDRIGGKILMQEYIRVIPRPPRYVPQEGYNVDTALKIKRMYGDKALEEYKALHEPEKPEGFLPKFQIFEGMCPKTVETIPHCVYAANTKGKPNEDVAEFPGDDPYDETRYGIEACQRYLDGGMGEYETAMKVEKAVLQLQNSGDMTSYYMKMDKIEHTAQLHSAGRVRMGRRRVGRTIDSPRRY